MEEATDMVVAKPFNTVNRRFAVGDPVSEAEVVDRDFGDLKRRKFIVGKDTKAADKAADRADQAAEPIIAGSPGPVPQPELPPADEEPGPGNRPRRRRA